LLAKAAQAKAEASAAPGPSDEALPAFSSLQVVSRELDEIAAPRSSDGSPLRIGGAPLSSTNLLLFGTVTGLALVASLFTLLIKLAPQQPAHEGPATATTIVPATTVAATASGQPPAPIPSVAPPPPRKKLEGPWRIGEPKTGQKKISGKIGQEPFLKAVQTAGLDKTQAYRVYTALKDERNLDRCAPRHEFVALLEKASGRVVAFEYIVSREEVYQAKEGDDGLLKGQQLDLKVQRNRVQGSLLLAGESFEAAARAAHFDPSLRLVLNKALEGHTSVAQFRRGDRLRVVAQEVTVLGEFSRYAGLEAIEYLPASGDPLRIYYFNKRKRYYDAKGRAPGEGGWRKPIKGAPITSKFNPKRMHPILKKRMPHNGTDFGAPAGTPVYASSYGTITKRGNYGANGNFIAIAHEKGYETGYSHLSRFEDGIKVGDQVKRMQVIGYVGSTGRSTGPHLHFSAKKNGAFIDPESLKLDALTVLPPEDRADFTKVRRQYDELLEAVVLPPKLPDAEPAGPEQPPTMADTVAETMGEEMMGEPSASGATAGAAQAPTAPQVAPGAPSAQSSAAAAPAPVAAAPVNNFRSLYLSDKELMESQAASDEDEVEE
jgi:murein DD-endopeptidase MepM/ murein hydrolase activator NlpD